MVWWQILITVLGGVFTILSIIAFFVKPILNLNTNLTEQSSAIKTLTEAVKNLLKYVDKNDECHTMITDKLSEHNTRITVLEDWRKGVD